MPININCLSRFCYSKMIQSENVAGVYVIPSFKSSFRKTYSTHKFCNYKANFYYLFPVWFGVIFVREGFYKDGIFRFHISLPDKFPDHQEVPVSSGQKCRLISIVIGMYFCLDNHLREQHNSSSYLPLY